MRILFVGDIMGSSGRGAFGKLVEDLRSRFDACCVIVNGENAAGGIGITKPTAMALLDAGADVITLGNHAFAKRDILAYLKEQPRLLRPANYPAGTPGMGWGVFETAGGYKIAVVNLVGRAFMTPVDCPFHTVDMILEKLGGATKTIIVDMHAEATSEKVAMGWYLDGRVSAVIGTHTHVQTADERILPGGTAYLTDVGMTGVHDSVLGMNTGMVIERFKTQVQGKFQLAEGRATLQAVVIEIDPDTGHALAIERISVPESA